MQSWRVPDSGLTPVLIDSVGQTVESVACLGALIQVSHIPPPTAENRVTLHGLQEQWHALHILHNLLKKRGGENISNIIFSQCRNEFFEWIWPFFTTVECSRAAREASPFFLDASTAEIELHSRGAVQRTLPDRIFEDSVSAIAMVIAHAMEVDSANVGSFIDAMLRSLEQFSGWGGDAVGLARTIFNSLMARVVLNSKSWKADLQSPMWASLLDMIGKFRMFIFHHPRRRLGARATTKYALRVIDPTATSEWAASLKSDVGIHLDDLVRVTFCTLPFSFHATRNLTYCLWVCLGPSVFCLSLCLSFS